jgi:hypothetical protein
MASDQLKEARMALAELDFALNYQRIVDYVSAPAGSGKSHQAAAIAKNRAASGDLVVWAAPTKDVIDELVRKEFEPDQSCPHFVVFHGGTAGEGNVVREIARHFKDAPSEGHIVFITHSALRLVPYWGEWSRIYLIIDETLEVVWHRGHQIPETHQIISEAIHVEPTGPIYGIVEAMDVDRVEELARNVNKDELIKPLQETLWALLNPHLTTYVNLQRYQDLLAGRGKTIGFHSVLQPSVLERFCNVLIIAANFEQSLTFKIWSDLGVKFRRDKKFEKELRYSTH